MKKMERNKRNVWPVGTTAMLILGFCLAFTSRAQVTQERTLGAFTGIENRCSIDLYLSQGATQQVMIEADESVIEKVNTWLDGDVLVIDIDRINWNVKTLKAFVTVKELEHLVINGSGDLKTETVIRSPLLNIQINGSGDLNMQMDVGKMDLRISGSGDATVQGDLSEVFVSVSGSGDMTLIGGDDMVDCMVKLTGSGDIDLSGRTGKLQIKQVSSGDVDASDLIAGICFVEKSGSGDTSVNVNGDLSVVSSGSGDVFYRGDTRIESISVSGSGDVRKIK